MIPAATHPELQRLEPLVGEWLMDASIDGRLVARARTTFAWLAGGAFLHQHADLEPDASMPSEWLDNAPFPVESVIGLDDAAGTFTMLYADGRGVSRVYETDVQDGILTIRRAAPAFHQRFAGTIGADGRTITGRWEGSGDGETWTYDFDVTYRKVT
ncbi:hypothetical protein J7E87_33470 [Streptomyces sp. ISL-1]|uniref:hypothetical protein n=1 Tax=Streptomyces sp. ISL-1 TaxID=2817657 RepID=UPI001BEA006E|nr:hypothetical protein [Streptomyces sp. ISL-1]MBT2394188.1 hypothetical protein [Streptomyces sp. ISL-1]